MAKNRVNPKKTGAFLLVAGAVMLLSAQLLFHYNHLDDVRAGQHAERVVEDIEKVITENTLAGISSDENAPEEYVGILDFGTELFSDEEMPTVILDGYAYIGYLTIPAMNLELPVMSEGDYDRLKIAPCRQFGSTRTDDLVIAAHNYQSNFGRLKDLTAGDTVTFTDMDGLSNLYSIRDIRILSPTEVDAVQNSGFDLVLYTCTYGGKSRVTAFCSRIGEK